MVVATHEGGPNGWFLIALLVPMVVGPALWLLLTPLRRRTGPLARLVPALVVALTAMSLHVSVVTWRHHKDVAMCRSWDPLPELDRCIAERRARASGPWGIFVRSGNGD